MSEGYDADYVRSKPAEAIAAEMNRLANARIEASNKLNARPEWTQKRREWLARYLAATLASGGPNDRLFKVNLPKWINDVHDAFEDVGRTPLTEDAA